MYTIFTHVEFEKNDLAEAIYTVATGNVCAAVVRALMPPKKCAELADFVLKNTDQRVSDIPGGTLGPSLFEHLHTPEAYFCECEQAASKLAIITTQLPEALTLGMKAFESFSEHCRIEALALSGQTANIWRGLVFPAQGSTVIPPHEDLSNLHAMRGIHPKLSTALAPHVLAQNFYLQNNVGQGKLRVYDWRPTQAEKVKLDRKYRDQGLDLIRTGYNYPAAELLEKDFFEITPCIGDYVIFRSDYVHSVLNDALAGKPEFPYRVSLNGFLAPVVLPGYAAFLSCWT